MVCSEKNWERACDREAVQEGSQAQCVCWIFSLRPRFSLHLCAGGWPAAKGSFVLWVVSECANQGHRHRLEREWSCVYSLAPTPAAQHILQTAPSLCLSLQAQVARAPDVVLYQVVFLHPGHRFVSNPFFELTSNYTVWLCYLFSARILIDGASLRNTVMQRPGESLWQWRNTQIQRP